mgnify:CR=1 FL=1
MGNVHRYTGKCGKAQVTALAKSLEVAIYSVGIQGFDTPRGFLKNLEDAANAPLVELSAASMLAGLGAIGSDGVPQLLV